MFSTYLNNNYEENKNLTEEALIKKYLTDNFCENNSRNFLEISFYREGREKEEFKDIFGCLKENFDKFNKNKNGIYKKNIGASLSIFILVIIFLSTEMYAIFKSNAYLLDFCNKNTSKLLLSEESMLNFMLNITTTVTIITSFLFRKIKITIDEYRLRKILEKQKKLNVMIDNFAVFLFIFSICFLEIVFFINLLSLVGVNYLYSLIIINITIPALSFIYTRE